MSIKKLLFACLLLLQMEVNAQKGNFKLIDSFGNEYKTRFPIVEQKDLGDLYYLYSCESRYVNSRDSTDRFIARKSNNVCLHKLLVNEYVHLNASGGLNIFEQRYINTTKGKEDETLRNYEVYLSFIDTAFKIIPKQKLFLYVEHDSRKNLHLNMNFNAIKSAINKKTNQLYLIRNKSQYDFERKYVFEVYDINTSEQITIEEVCNFNFDPKISEDYMEITMKDLKSVVYDCKKMKPAKVELNFPKTAEQDFIKTNPRLKNTEWTFEYGGSINNLIKDKRIKITEKGPLVNQLTPAVIEIKYKDNSDDEHKVAVFDIRKNRVLKLATPSKEDPSFMIYSKDASEIFEFSAYSIEYSNLSVQLDYRDEVNLEGIYNRKEKKHSDYYNQQIKTAVYNEDLKQLYWHLPKDNKSVIYDLAKRDFVVINNSLGFVFNHKESRQHLIIKKMDQTNYYYDCIKFKSVGDKLPEEAPKNTQKTDSLYYTFYTNSTNTLKIYNRDSLIASIKLPKSRIQFAYIDQSHKNVVYYCYESDKNSFKDDFVFLDNNDAVNFQKNDKVLAEKRSLYSFPYGNRAWEAVPAQFALLNEKKGLEDKEINDSLKKFYLTLKRNYVNADTSLFTNNRSVKGKYAYYFEYPTNYGDFPLERSTKQGLTVYDTPDIYKLDTNKVLLSFYGKLCAIDLTTDSVNFYTFSKGRTVIAYLSNDLYLLNGEYICNLKENRFVYKIVFKEGDFQRHFNVGKYLHIAEALDNDRTLLQVVDATNLEIVKQDTVKTGFYKVYGSNAKNFGIYSLNNFSFVDNIITCTYYHPKNGSQKDYFYCSKNAINKDISEPTKSNTNSNSSLANASDEQRNKLYMSNLVRFVDFSYLFLDFDEHYRFNTYSPEFKDNYDVHMSLDTRFRGKRKRYKLGKEKIEVVQEPQEVPLTSKTKVVLEKCPKCAGQKSWGGERSNCGKCGGSGFDATKKCTAKGCVLGYQSVETIKTAGSILKNGVVAYTEKEKKKCIWCLGTEKGLCSECGGKGGKVSAVITCDKCKGSGWIDKTVSND